MRWLHLVAWVGITILYLLTSLFWFVIMALLGMGGTPEDVTALVSLFVCGWPIAVILVLAMGVSSIIVRRRQKDPLKRGRILRWLAVVPYLLWVLILLPFLLFDFLSS